MVISRLLRLCAAATVLAAAVACTGDDEASSTDSTTQPGSPESTTESGSRAPRPTTAQGNAPLKVSIEQLRGGVEHRQRPTVREAVTRPIRQWISGAYLGDYPRTSYPDAFTGWTKTAAVQARRDESTTTFGMVGRRTLTQVADHQRVRLYVFASDGRTGGATAHVDLRMTAHLKDRSTSSFMVTGRLYLVRDGSHWRIFGYDLSRQEVA